jgi:hypothetical protein
MPAFATGRWLPFPDWSYSNETVHVVPAQTASTAAASAKPSAVCPMSWVSPPEPVFCCELPLRT